MQVYQHRDQAQNLIDCPVGKVICVGRNYLDHVKELNNPVPKEPILFMKPKEALVSLHQPLSLPEGLGPCHNEVEIAILMQSSLTKANPEQVYEAIGGVGIGLDLTLREVQSRLKQQGLPWERAKSFDGSCPVSHFVSKTEFADLNDIAFSLKVNGEVRQQGNTQQMMTNMLTLLANISQSFTLSVGDIVMTGTPKGVGPLHSGDRVSIQVENAIAIETTIL
jgi:2-keto-4-pentenoate hydratase/2-oxohepta-3-ene-1,7-dioic acid hydratase in catechol pathway